MINTGIFLR